MLIHSGQALLARALPVLAAYKSAGAAVLWCGVQTLLVGMPSTNSRRYVSGTV